MYCKICIYNYIYNGQISHWVAITSTDLDCHCCVMLATSAKIVNKIHSFGKDLSWLWEDSYHRIIWIIFQITKTQPRRCGWLFDKYCYNTPEVLHIVDVLWYFGSGSAYLPPFLIQAFRTCWKWNQTPGWKPCDGNVQVPGVVSVLHFQIFWRTPKTNYIKLYTSYELCLFTTLWGMFEHIHVMSYNESYLLTMYITLPFKGQCLTGNTMCVNIRIRSPYFNSWVQSICGSCTFFIFNPGSCLILHIDRPGMHHQQYKN